MTTQVVSEAVHCDQVALLADGQLIALESPDALRRSAFGGELLEITTPARSTARTCSSCPASATSGRPARGRWWR